MKKHSVSCLILSLGILSFGQSQSLLNPVNVAGRGSVTSSSIFENRTSMYGASKVVDNTWADDKNPWLAKGVYDTQAGTLPAWLKFDFGQEYTISSVSLFNTKNWIYNDRGAKDFNILVSSDGINYSTTILSGTLAWQNTSFQLFDFSSFVTTRYMQIEFTSTYGSYYQGVGLNEAQIMAVPEPSSLSLLALGGVVVALGNIRKKH
jgi:hypothetical protein